MNFAKFRMQLYAAALVSVAVASSMVTASESYEKMPWENERHAAPPKCTSEKSNPNELVNEDIRKCIDIYHARIYSAYQKVLIKNPNASGTIVLDMTISTDGTVSRISVDGSSTFPIELAKDISEKLYGIMFPPSKLGWRGKFEISLYDQ